MEKFKKYSKTLGVILICMTVFSPAFGSSPGDESCDGVRNNPEEKQTQEKVISKKFEELDAEYREKAKRLGYKEGDMVEMRKGLDGKLIILPPSQEILTPIKLKEKLMNLISQKIAKKVTDKDIDIQMKLALDLTGDFTLKTGFENLHETIQGEAKKKGYKKGDTVQIKFDAPSLEYRVVKTFPEMKWPAKILDVIPAKEEGGLPSYRCVSNFNVLPKNLQKQAKAKGYKKGDPVRHIFHAATNTFEILQKPLLIGLPCEWKELTPKEQKKAIKLGYKAGDIVWKSSDAKGKFPFPKSVVIKAVQLDGKVQLVIDTKGLFTLVPSVKVGDGPQMKITHVMMDGFTQKITFRCLAKFSEVSDGDRALALTTGYKKGDEILYYYDTKINRFSIQPPPKK